jgi:cytochrome o ubiquinol oxidase subunit IV
MSADNVQGHAPVTGFGEHGAPSDDLHGHAHDSHAAPHGSFQSYMTGFVLAAILTVIPFVLVMARPIESAGYTAAIVLICGLIQILVHMVFFLHMTPQAEDGWLLLSTIFTVVLVVITLAGSLWIVFHLNNNMMPGGIMDDMIQETVPAR